MKACRDFSLLVSLRAADALAPEDAPRLDAHLESCDRCRAELSATADALDLARLPAPGHLERRLMADLPERLIAEVRKGDRRRGVARRLAVLGSIAAASLLALAVPSGLRDRPAPAAPPDPTTTIASAGTTTWQTPDLDSIWQETDVVDFAADGGDDSEVAYATASYGSDSY